MKNKSVFIVILLSAIFLIILSTFLTPKAFLKTKFSQEELQLIEKEYGINIPQHAKIERLYVDNFNYLLHFQLSIDKEQRKIFVQTIKDHYKKNDGIPLKGNEEYISNENTRIIITVKDKSQEEIVDLYKHYSSNKNNTMFIQNGTWTRLNYVNYVLLNH